MLCTGVGSGGESNGQMLCTGVGSGGDFLDVFLNSILEHDPLDDLG